MNCEKVNTAITLSSSWLAVRKIRNYEAGQQQLLTHSGAVSKTTSLGEP